MAENPEFANISPSYPFDAPKAQEPAEPEVTEESSGQESDESTELQVPAESEGEQEPEAKPKKGDPIEAIVALRKENQALKQQLQQVAAYLQQQQAQPAQRKQEPPPDPLGKLDDDDVITVADMKKVLQFYAQQAQAQPQQPAVDPRELAIRTQFPDYDDSIKQIPALLEEYPHLRSAIVGSENPFLTAYSLVQMYKGKSKQGDKAVQKLMDNMSKPRSSGKVASGGGASKASYYASLDDKGLEAMIAKVKRGS